MKKRISELINDQPFVSSVFILLLAMLIAIILLEFRILERNQFITLVSIVFTAVITIFITFIQLHRNSEENRINREYQTRKKFLIYAFKEIIPSINNLQKSLLKINAFCLSIPINLKLSLENSNIYKFDTPDIRQNLLNEKIHLSSSVADFLFSIECFEIAMIDLIQYKIFIVDEIHTLLGNSDNNSDLDLIDGILSKICRDFNNRSTYYDDLNQETNRFLERIIEITGWLSDFVILIQNHFLSDVFNTKLPMRKPHNPKCKILTEIVSEKILKNLNKE